VRMDHDLEVQMRRPTVRVARAADGAEHIAAGHGRAGAQTHAIRVEVRVVVDEAPVGIDGIDDAAYETVMADGDHEAVVGGDDGGSTRSRDVESAMASQAATVAERVGHLVRSDARDGHHETTGSEGTRGVATKDCTARRDESEQ